MHHPADIETLTARVEAAVRRVCPAWLKDRADDIAQTVMIQLTSGEGVRTFSSIYLTRAAHGATVDEIRRVARRRESPDGEERMAQTATIDAGPDRRAFAGEIAAGIRACLVQLVRPRRLAVTAYLLGCGVPETADLLGWDRKRAENLVYRGLADLRRCLSGKGLEP